MRGGRKGQRKENEFSGFVYFRFCSFVAFILCERG